jgi:two-component system nitrogen regulation response regulator GlnG/two-component system response regulator HydG
MTDLDATTLGGGSDHAGRRGSEAAVLVLVVAWCPQEPARVGEIAVVSSSTPLLLGRGSSGDEPRLRFFRGRPGRLEPTPPLACPGLSRRQAELSLRGTEIEIRRVGQCPMRVNGVERDGAAVGPGDTIRFRQELVLLCLQRPACPEPLRHAEDAHLFGQVDSSGILGESPAAWSLRDRIAFAAKSGAHVLFIGDTGTGKELAARAVHDLSPRARKPLVARNAATLPAGLIDAELFGNVRNYPNPGMADRPGLIGQADGGYLFLDEIGELSSELQAHLLRVLDAGGEYQRLGESTVRRSDFLLLAATNRDPSDLKHDLLPRLKVHVELPPLAERREDIPLVVRHLVLRAAEKTPSFAGRFVEPDGPDGPRVRIDAKFIDEVLRRDFDANVRALDAVLYDAMAASPGDVIVWTDALERGMPGARSAANRPARAVPPPSRREEPSADEVRAVLAQQSGNVTRAARALGLSSRFALYRLMTKLGIGARDDSEG